MYLYKKENKRPWYKNSSINIDRGGLTLRLGLCCWGRDKLTLWLGLCCWEGGRGGRLTLQLGLCCWGRGKLTLWLRLCCWGRSRGIFTLRLRLCCWEGVGGILTLQLRLCCWGQGTKLTLRLRLCCWGGGGDKLRLHLGLCCWGGRYVYLRSGSDCAALIVTLFAVMAGTGYSPSAAGCHNASHNSVSLSALTCNSIFPEQCHTRYLCR